MFFPRSLCVTSSTNLLAMAMAYGLSHVLLSKQSKNHLLLRKINSSADHTANQRKPINELSQLRPEKKKKCLRCKTIYLDDENSPTACSFHGHTTGEKGFFALAPPHQGIDGEWSDRSGVIVYRWNDESDRPNTGRANWKKRWSCCMEYGEDALPCRKGRHVSYDDGFTLY